jgi:protein-tyrosine phosphatase
MAPAKRVLFVCMGNICRSPTGEGVFRDYVKKRGLGDSIQVDSAGTIGAHAGEAPDARMRRAARARGYELEGQARQFTAADFDAFDLIVAMDRANYRDILARDPGGRHAAKVKLLCAFNPKAKTQDVHDPYYGGPQGFEEVLDLIEGACEGILASLQEKPD